MPTKAKPKAEKPVKVIKAKTKEVKVVEVKEPKVTKAKPKKVATKPVEASQPVEAPTPKPKAEKASNEPVQGKKYIFTSGAGEFIASINGKNDKGYDLMTIYEVIGGCQSDRTLPIPDIGAFTFVDDPDEVFRRLSGN